MHHAFLVIVLAFLFDQQHRRAGGLTDRSVPLDLDENVGDAVVVAKHLCVRLHHEIGIGQPIGKDCFSKFNFGFLMGDRGQELAI